MHEDKRGFCAGEKDIELPNKTNSLGRKKHRSLVASLFLPVVCGVMCKSCLN